MLCAAYLSLSTGWTPVIDDQVCNFSCLYRTRGNLKFDGEGEGVPCETSN